MTNVINFEDKKIEKLKKEADMEVLANLLKTPIGEELYLWVLTTVINPETADIIDIHGRGKAFVESTQKKHGLHYEAALRFLYEVFTEAVFGRTVKEVTTNEVLAWMADVEQRQKGGK